jgi:hypothetical protein
MPINPKHTKQVIGTIDKIWVSRIVIDSPMVEGDSFAQLKLVPYSSQNHDIKDRSIILNIPSIKQKISSGDTKLAVAMAALLEAIQAEFDKT